MQIEQVWKTKLSGLCFGSITLGFCSRPSYSATCEDKMGNDFFPSITFCLLSFDRVRRFRIGGFAIVDIQSGQHPNQANGSACSFVLKLMSGRRGTMYLTMVGSNPEPPETIQ